MSRRSATIIRTMAPKRSDQGARLKNSHHTRTANPQTSPPSIPNSDGLGNDDGDDEPDQPLQHHGDDAGPQPERLAGSRFVGLRDGHVQTIRSSPAVCSLFIGWTPIESRRDLPACRSLSPASPARSQARAWIE